MYAQSEPLPAAECVCGPACETAPMLPKLDSSLLDLPVLPSFAGREDILFLRSWPKGDVSLELEPDPVPE